MKRFAPIALVLSGALLSCSAPAPRSDDRRALDAIDTVVVIYAENRAFDTLFGLFPGANGIPGVNPSAVGGLRGAGRPRRLAARDPAADLGRPDRARAVADGERGGDRRPAEPAVPAQRPQRARRPRRRRAARGR